MAAAAFDRLAENYDTLWARSVVGLYQRQAVWRSIDPLIRKGDSVLDLGCGTGEDAVHLMSRGARVYAIDASRAMVRIARSKGVNAHVLPVQLAGNLARQFDVALSNFGVFNCIQPLDDIAPVLAALVRPGGYLAVCLMGSCCLWESAHFLRRGSFTKAFRRLSPNGAPSGIGVHVTYPRIKELTRVFGSCFKLSRWSAIGLCIPPSYVTGLRRGTLARLARIDSRIAHWPLLRAFADHRLLLFTRL